MLDPGFGFNGSDGSDSFGVVFIVMFCFVALFIACAAVAIIVVAVRRSKSGQPLDIRPGGLDTNRLMNETMRQGQFLQQQMLQDQLNQQNIQQQIIQNNLNNGL